VYEGVRHEADTLVLMGVMSAVGRALLKPVGSASSERLGAVLRSCSQEGSPTLSGQWIPRLVSRRMCIAL
jgi:hypothetical protein